MVVSVQGAIRDSIHGDLRIRALCIFSGRYVDECAHMQFWVEFPHSVGGQMVNVRGVISRTWVFESNLVLCFFCALQNLQNFVQIVWFLAPSVRRKLIAHVAIFVCFQFDMWLNGCSVILVDFCDFWQVDVCQNYCKCASLWIVTWMRCISACGWTRCLAIS